MGGDGDGGGKGIGEGIGEGNGGSGVEVGVEGGGDLSKGEGGGWGVGWGGGCEGEGEEGEGDWGGGGGYGVSGNFFGGVLRCLCLVGFHGGNLFGGFWLIMGCCSNDQSGYLAGGRVSEAVGVRVLDYYGGEYTDDSVDTERIEHGSVYCTGSSTGSWLHHFLNAGG